VRQVIALECPTVAITQDERAFFVALGARIAQLREDGHITQAQLAETLGISQSTVNAYELGNRRVPGVHAATAGAHAGRERGRADRRRCHRGTQARPGAQATAHMERISALPKPRQRAVIDVIEAMLAQQGR